MVETFGDCKDWTPHVVYQKLLPIVAIISGNIFLGEELCRSESYLYHSIHYTVWISKLYPTFSSGPPS